MGLLDPIPLREGVTSTQGGFTYRLRRERELWILSARDAAADMDLYEFTEEPQTAWDIEVANHFTSTHPESIFRKSLTVQQTRGSARTIRRWTSSARKPETFSRIFGSGRCSVTSAARPSPRDCSTPSASSR